MIEWGSPKNFQWLWVLPLVVGIFYISSWRRKKQMRHFGDVVLVQRLIASLNISKRWTKRALLLFTIFFMILALGQPHFRTKEITVERKGVDVMIAVDVSRSMLAKDIQPSRLDKAKLELSSLIDHLKQDRIGIVAFAGEAFIQCPLTLDRSAVKLFLTTLNPNLIPTPGTILGAAIRVATQAFAEKEKEYKALILLTDGEDQGSNPLEAVKKAKEAGVRIFTIGIGTQDGGTIPGEFAGEGVKKDRQGQVVISKLDERLLKKIAEETGGAYYRSSGGEFEIESLSNEIRNMSQKGLKKEKSYEYEENYQYFLILALILLFFEMILSERKRHEA